MKSVYDILDDLGEQMCSEIKTELVKRNKMASGKLYNSVTYKIKEVKKDSYILELNADKYLTFVDRGRKAGKMPPVDPIVQWIKVKRIAITPESTMTARAGKPRAAKRGRGAAKDSQVRGAAFAIAKSIGKKGIAPFGRKSSFMDRIMAKYTGKNLTKKIQKAIVIAFQEETKKQFREFK